MQAGTKLGHYTVRSEIGRGGMGVVWRAEDSKLGREVAIKTLPEEFAHDADRMARFDREAKLLAALNHPNIASIYGLEEHEGTRFLVLELVEGPTLADRIAEGAIGVDESLKLALQIAEALEAAHGNGVIHRDLKPANIKITASGTVKVLDFGLAKAFGGSEESNAPSNSPTLSMQATQQGVVLGTASYMAPEQAKGRSTDKRADIWAFGCVLYEMLTGQSAFDGEDVSEILASVIKGTTNLDLLPSGLHPASKKLIGRCLAKDTRKRFQDIGDVRYELEETIANPALPAAVALPAAKSPPSLPWLGAGLLGGALIVALAVWISRSAPESSQVIRFDHELETLVNVGRQTLAVDPNGSGFVYVSGDGLRFRPFVSLEATLIPGTGGAVGPFFSPDGEWVAFWANGSLYKVPISGGTPVNVGTTASPLGASWSRDDMILFALNDEIWRVPGSGGTPEMIIDGAPGPSTDGPQLLPGGEWVLYSAGVVNNWDQAQIVVESLESGERHVVWTGGSAAHYLDTGHLVYAQGNSLFAIRFDLDAMETTGGPVPIVENVQRAATSANANYDVTDRGTLVYLEGTGGPAESRALALVDRSGRLEFLDIEPRQYLSPRISPDGRRLAVQTDGVDGSQIWTYDLSGETAISRLTLEGNNYRPTWTPDGERITFASDREGTTSIYSQAADGSGVAERLTTAPEGIVHWPESWSPDGATLAFRVESTESGGTNITSNEMDIWTVTFEGETAEEPVVFSAEPHPFQEVGAMFSPDGRWLAYAGGDGPALGFQIFVEPFPPTGERRLVSREFGIMPLWAANGQELFYRTVNQTGNSPQTLRKIDVSTNPSFTFTTEEAVPIGQFMSFGYYRSFDVTPDGERFVVVLPPEQSGLEPAPPKVNVVVNWTEELLERVPVE